MSPYAHITGWGTAIPEKILTNEELSQTVDTSDDWIREMTGIWERRIASQEQSTASLATDAALEALESANLRPEELDSVFDAGSHLRHVEDIFRRVFGDA